MIVLCEKHTVGSFTVEPFETDGMFDVADRLSKFVGNIEAEAKTSMALGIMRPQNRVMPLAAEAEQPGQSPEGTFGEGSVDGGIVSSNYGCMSPFRSFRI